MPRPRTVRYAGLVGSLLLAVTAYLGGSETVRGSIVSVQSILRGDDGIALPVCWLAGTTLLIAAWWWGRHVVPSTRWALVTAGLWLLPLLPFLPLGSDDVYSYACQGWVQYAGLDPYAAGPQELGCPWIDAVSPIWRDSPAPYGPVFLLVSAVAVEVSGVSLLGTVAGLRVIAVAGVALIAAGLPVLARHAGASPARAVWWMLACPLVGVHLVSGAHNDALMVGLLVTGLAVVVSRPTAPAALVAGGALLGLAVGVKATAVVVLPFAVLMAVPPRSALRALVAPAVAIGGGAVGATVVVSLAAGRGLGWVRGLLRSGDSVQWTSPSTAVGLTVDYLGRAVGRQWNAVPVTRTIAVLLLAVLLAGLFLWARGGAPFAAGLALAATVVFAPVVHPWYLTWPLAVLAATWTRPGASLTRWLLVPCAVACALILPDGSNLARTVKLPGSVAMTALVVVLVVLAVRSGVRAVRTGAVASETVPAVGRGAADR